MLKKQDGKILKIGDIVQIIACKSYCEVTEIYKPEAHSESRGHIWVEVLDTGEEATFCLDEVEVISECW
jgi:hypothetical protein